MDFSSNERRGYLPPKPLIICEHEGLGLLAGLITLQLLKIMVDFEKVAVKDNNRTCLFARNSTVNMWPCYKVLSKMCPTISVLLEC